MDEDGDDYCDPIVLKGAERMEALITDCQDCFSDYMDDLRDVVSGGYMEFTYENDELMVVVCYDSNRKLTKKEKNYLISYTSNQLSDGIGEGFEETPFHSDANSKYYVSRGIVLRN